MQMRPDIRWIRAVPTDSGLLPLRSVLDGQIRRAERQAKQQALSKRQLLVVPSVNARLAIAQTPRTALYIR
jgi:hypothetical protein